jgi:hypothetical protein
MIAHADAETSLAPSLGFALPKRDYQTVRFIMPN